MRLFTVYPDNSIENYIVMRLQNKIQPEVTAVTAVEDDIGFLREIGPRVLPTERTPADEDRMDVARVHEALSRHDAMVLFLRSEVLDEDRYFIPTITLCSYACAELMRKDQTYQIASLWFLDSPGCLIHHKTHWSLTPDGLLLPTQL